MRRFLGVTVLVLASGILFLPWGQAGQDGDGGMALETPAQVEHFMQMDAPAAFSHAMLFNATAREAKALQLKEAVDLGIRNNLASKIAHQKVEQALGRKWQAMSGLLPHVEGSVMERRTFKQNLEAQGMKGYGYIGPFNTFDARLQLIQQVINVSAVSNFQAGVRESNAARYEKEFVRQKVVLLVALDYLGALRAQASYRAAEANVSLSRRLLDRAEHQLKAGLANSVDAARARTRLAQDELRLAAVRAGVHDAYLDLQRSTGLPYDGVMTLMNTLTFIREQIPDLAQASVMAEKERLDIRVATERAKACMYKARGAKTQLLPHLEFVGDVGTIGNEWDKHDKRTGSAMLRASMPLFEGGKILGEIKEANSYARQAELYAEDVKLQVAEDLRKALWFLDTAIEQVTAAGHVVGLAEHELTLASDRFAQGVGDNIEVLNAQTALADARDGYVEALMRYHTARINFYFAVGKPETFFLQDAG